MLLEGISEDRSRFIQRPILCEYLLDYFGLFVRMTAAGMNRSPSDRWTKDRGGTLK